MLVIGLTGGIASGKTAVSDFFAELGTPIIDTDIIARELVQPRQQALQAIVERFGADCLTATGELDRRYLRQQVFSDAAAKHDLEQILHPRIRATVQQRLAQLKAPYCVLVVPLLIETSDAYQVDRILVVDVPEHVQIERVMQRDQITREQAKRMLDAQASRDGRLAKADDVIENNASLTQLYQSVLALHQRYLALAQDDN